MTELKEESDAEWFTGKERRVAPRIDLTVEVRYLLRGEEEGVGVMLNISEVGMALLTDVDAREGDEIVVYPEGIGRIPGKVARTFDGGFCPAFTLSARETETLKKRIGAVLQGLPYFRLSERRSSFRIDYNIETQARFEGSDEFVDCTLVDLSNTGCRVKCGHTPELGARVVIGALKGVVNRRTDDGFAVEFVKQAPSQAASKFARRIASAQTRRSEESSGHEASLRIGEKPSGRGGAG